jgi:hypothetical protein
MKLQYLLTASVGALALGLGTPALGQEIPDIDVDTIADDGSNAASRGGEIEIGNTDTDTDTDIDTTADNGSNAASRGGEIEVGNSESDDDVDTTADNGSIAASRGGEVEVGNLEGVDTLADNGSNAASRGGEIEIGNSESDDDVDTTSDNGSVSASRGGEVDTVASGAGSYAASRGGEIEVGNTEVVANQYLVGIISNQSLDDVEELADSESGYNSGSNSVDGSSFSAFAGILNQAWNTGVNANVQAGTNVAAQGTVNFGSGGGGATTP